MFCFLVSQFCLLSNPYFICRFMLNIILQVLLQLSLYLQVFGGGTLTRVCRGVHQCFHIFHLCLVYFTAIYLTFLFSTHSLAFVSIIYITFSFSAFTHQQEPTLLSYRQKGAIPTPVVRRNPYYRTGDHTRLIPQDPWSRFLKFQVFSIFSVVFKISCQIQFRSSIFPVLSIVEASARKIRVSLATVQVTVGRI